MRSSPGTNLLPFPIYRTRATIMSSYKTWQLLMSYLANKLYTADRHILKTAKHLHNMLILCIGSCFQKQPLIFDANSFWISNFWFLSQIFRAVERTWAVIVTGSWHVWKPSAMCLKLKIKGPQVKLRIMVVTWYDSVMEILWPIYLVPMVRAKGPQSSDLTSLLLPGNTPTLRSFFGASRLSCPKTVSFYLQQDPQCRMHIGNRWGKRRDHGSEVPVKRWFVNCYQAKRGQMVAGQIKTSWWAPCNVHSRIKKK